jgi:hypothetical protein
MRRRCAAPIEALAAMDRRLPPAVRKELLLSRGALERIELAQALNDFRRARRPLQVAGEILAGRRGGGVGAGLLGAISLVRKYPYLGSVASIAFGATRRSGVGRWVRRIGVLAALAAGGLWLATRRSEPSGH